MLPLTSSKGASQIAPCTFHTRSCRAGHVLAALCGARDGVGGPGRNVAAILVFTLSLSAVGTLLGGNIANGLEEASLADLASHEVVHAILEGVDLLDASDFGLVEIFCYGVRKDEDKTG